MAREMKDSGIEWIGEIPETWNISKIKHVAEFDPKCDFSKLTADSIITYTPMENIKNGYYIPNTAFFGLLSTSLTAYQDNDIVLAKVTPCFENGNIAIMNNLSSGIGLGSSELFVFRAKQVTTRYLFFWLQNKAFMDRAKSTMTGTGGLKRVSPSFIRNCEIHNPPLQEQQRITDFLDSQCARIDAVIEQTLASIEEYKKLKQAVITQAVTKGIRPGRKMKDSSVEWIGEIPDSWNMSKVKYVAYFQPSCDTSKLTDDSEITYTPMECIKNGYFINNTASLGKVAASLTPYIDGDIVMAKVTPCFENGNIAIMEDLASGFGLGSSELFVIRPHSIETRFLFYWLQNNLFMQQGCATMTGTGGLKRVSSYFVKNCPVTYPSIEEQHNIIDYLDNKTKKIDLLISKKEQYLSELETCRKSLIYEYVTGKKEVL